MSKVEIYPRLYIGGKLCLSDTDVEWGLVVNVTPDVQFACGPAATTLRVPVLDIAVISEYKKMLLSFPSICSAIESTLEDGGCVLVHCNEGQQRSAAVMCAYLMTKLHLSCDNAIQALKQKYPRAFSDGEPRFREALRVWERFITQGRQVAR